jgi:hypothetical protein
MAKFMGMFLPVFSIKKINPNLIWLRFQATNIDVIPIRV